ncbi:MAG: oligosaccharide flippase family protein [Lachnospiraceae bacterium]
MINIMKDRWRKIPLTVKVSISYTVCSILQNCISFITLPLFTRLLTTEQYGQCTIYGSWSSILMIFVTLNLAYGSFSAAMIKFENRRDEYITSVQGICLLLAGIFFLIYIPFRNLWNKLFELPTILVCILIVEILFANATNMWMSKNRFEFKYKKIVALSLSLSILSPLVSYIFVIGATEKGYARIIGSALVNILFGIVIFVVCTKKGKKFYNKEFWKYALGFNIPLLVYYLSQAIFNQSDRIMISHMTGTDNAAMYGVAYNLAMVLTFVLSAINGSYVPWMYGKMKDGNEEENKSVSIVLVLLMALMILCVIWYAPEIITIMAGKQYTAAIYVVAPVAMSLLLLFYSQLFINVEFYYAEKKMLVFASIGAAVLNIILNYVLIPVFGFVVAGYTTLISYIVFVISNYYAMKRVLIKRNLPDNMYDYKWLILIFVTFMVSGFLGVALYSWIIPRILITILILVLVILNRSKFLYTIAMIRKK